MPSRVVNFTAGYINAFILCFDIFAALPHLKLRPRNKVSYSVALHLLQLLQDSLQLTPTHCSNLLRVLQPQNHLTSHIARVLDRLRELSPPSCKLTHPLPGNHAIDGTPGLSIATNRTHTWTPIASRTRARIKNLVNN